ncbi:hypothetical protein [Micromonospora sp. NBC_00421]|uniref:hypothetical protein n=1 Tax=Micromonospora sp. NBC_00421 TaxID=2975976 RepID=UPI002E1A744A
MDNRPDPDDHPDNRTGPDQQRHADRRHRAHPTRRAHDNQRAHDNHREPDNRRPYDNQRSTADGPPEPGGDLGLLVSDQDVEDADDILFAHPPRVVTHRICGCGDDYPCEQVRYARLIKAVAARGRR